MKPNDIDMRGKIAVALDLVEECKEFAALIPEVRTNLVYARPNSRSRDDVLGIDGRITVVSGLPHAAGKPRFGASSHMAISAVLPSSVVGDAPSNRPITPSTIDASASDE